MKATLFLSVFGGGGGYQLFYNSKIRPKRGKNISNAFFSKQK